MNSFVRSRLTYACQNWNLKQTQFDRLDSCYTTFLRRIVRGGFRRCEGDDSNQFKLKITNAKLHKLCNTQDVSLFIKQQQCNYAGHLIRTLSNHNTKKCITMTRMQKLVVAM